MRVAKLRAQITTVDPASRVIEVATVDGAARRLFVADIDPAGFVWPQVGEEWSIYDENGYWRLGAKFLSQDESALFESLQPGDHYPGLEPGPPGPQGPIGPAGPQGPPGVGAGSGDLTYVHTQGAPSTTWVAVHNLGKYPAVTVVDSADDEVTVDVHHDSTNQTTLTASAAFSGKAFFN